MEAAASTIPKNPKIPATRAIIRNSTDHFNMSIHPFVLDYVVSDVHSAAVCSCSLTWGFCNETSINFPKTGKVEVRSNFVSRLKWSGNYSNNKTMYMRKRGSSMIYQISVALIAVAFAVLVFFLIRTLKSAQGSLDNVSKTLQEVQKTIDELSYEVKQTVRHANDITADVQHKMKQIDPVMESVQNLGEVLNEVTEAAKQVSTTMIAKFQTKRSNQDPQNKRAEVAKVQTTPATPTDRTLQSYQATNNDTAKGGKNWVKYIDLAANVWQRMRK